jgi:hypothetical protein
LKYPLFLLLALFSLPAFAQEGELPDEQIIIQKDKKITLPELAKPSEKVTLTLKPLPKIKQKYTYREFSLMLPLLEPKPAAPVLRPEAESPVGQGYVCAGGGNYGSTLFDGFYNSGRRKDYSMNFLPGTLPRRVDLLVILDSATTSWVQEPNISPMHSILAEV